VTQIDAFIFLQKSNTMDSCSVVSAASFPCTLTKARPLNDYKTELTTNMHILIRTLFTRNFSKSCASTSNEFCFCHYKSAPPSSILGATGPCFNALTLTDEDRGFCFLCESLMVDLILYTSNSTTLPMQNGMFLAQPLVSKSNLHWIEICWNTKAVHCIIPHLKLQCIDSYLHWPVLDRIAVCSKRVERAKSCWTQRQCEVSSLQQCETVVSTRNLCSS
jgi:hypothetical protein